LAKILIVEDDGDLSHVLSVTLSSKGHCVQTSTGGAEALDFLRSFKYDLVILDWMMPEITGLDVLKSYRDNHGKAPVLMLTAKAEVSDKALGLDTGADDYLTKPFHPQELLARVRALLRRPHSLAAVVLSAGPISLDPASCQVTRNGEELHLRPKVFSLLEFFMRHPDQVFTSEAILERVWMDDSLASPDTVRTHIKLLRKSIGETGESGLIKNVRNRGYMLSLST
jgi:two-component system, OmpR family, response regulator